MNKRRAVKLEDIFVSVVFIPDADSQKLHTDLEKLGQTMRDHYSNYEIILVENKISPANLARITELLKTIACVRVIRLSRDYPKDICVYVGLEAAIGDIVVVRTSNDPINLIPKLAAKVQKAELVFGLSTQKIRSGLTNNYGAKLFYWYNKKFLGISIPVNSTYFIAFSRKAVNALTRSNRSAKHIRYLARQIGYEAEDFPYKPIDKYKREKKHLYQLFMSAIELATNYSKHPLRFLAWLGFLGSFLNLGYAGYVIGVRLVKNNVAEGWTTLSLQSALMFFLLFAILAVLCEYIGKILEETWHEPQYYILDELNSKVRVADATRRNIAR